MEKGYHKGQELTMSELGLSLEELAGQPLELFARERARLLLTVALEEEVTDLLKRRPYERSQGNIRGYRNGHRERQVRIELRCAAARAQGGVASYLKSHLFDGRIICPSTKSSSLLVKSPFRCRTAGLSPILIVIFSGRSPVWPGCQVYTSFPSTNILLSATSELLPYSATIRCFSPSVSTVHFLPITFLLSFGSCRSCELRAMGITNTLDSRSPARRLVNWDFPLQLVMRYRVTSLLLSRVMYIAPGCQAASRSPAVVVDIRAMYCNPPKLYFLAFC